ncbi:hypothetical protein [Lederbergia ruris]|uniref:hypothetical protein n=1 Tax=Lederbergia ruris TaxID=217495 RepID=UPI0039A15BBC
MLIQPWFGCTKIRESRENADPTVVWMYENRGEPRKCRSNDGLDVRKQGKSEKMSIQRWFGCTKIRESRENVDSTVVWMYENKREPRKCRFNGGLDVRKQGRVEKMPIQRWFGCTKTEEEYKNIDRE